MYPRGLFPEKRFRNSDGYRDGWCSDFITTLLLDGLRTALAAALADSALPTALAAALAFVEVALRAQIIR